jgi:hypothetical protein
VFLLLPNLGVPGDMNLLFLDYIEDMPEITWSEAVLYKNLSNSRKRERIERCLFG